MRRTTRGFTMIELLMSLLIAAGAILIMFRLIAVMQDYFLVGSVNLNQLQEARMALDYLRRDYLSACPYLPKTVPAAVFERCRRDPFYFADAPGAVKPQTQPVEIRKNEISFYRFTDTVADGTLEAKVEPVTYSLDPSSGDLLRSTPNQVVRFHGFQEIEFAPYVTADNPRIPVLWVRLSILDAADAAKIKHPKPLSLSTTIGSAFTDSVLQHPDWHYTTTQQ